MISIHSEEKNVFALCAKHSSLPGLQVHFRVSCLVCK